MPNNLYSQGTGFGFDMSEFQDLMNPMASGGTMSNLGGAWDTQSLQPQQQGMLQGTLAGGLGSGFAGQGPWDQGGSSGSMGGMLRGLGKNLQQNLKSKMGSTPWGAVAKGAGMLMSGAGAYRQAKRTRQGLGKAIKEISPLQGKFALEQKSMKDEAAKFRIGGRYSDIMTEQMLDTGAQAGQSMAQKFESMGISSPSMARQVGNQSRRATLAQLPGAQLSLAQGAMPYEKMAFGYGQQHKDVTEQLATLRGTRQSIDPTASLMSSLGGSLMSFMS